MRLRCLLHPWTARRSFQTLCKFAPRNIFRKPSIPTGPSINVAGRMSRFPGGSAQLEPLLGRQAGASSHLQATIPTLLQALSASESTVSRLSEKQARYRQASTGWLAEAGRRRGQPAAWCIADSGLRRASRPRTVHHGLEDCRLPLLRLRRSPAHADGHLNPHGQAALFSGPTAHRPHSFHYRCRSSSSRARVRARSCSPTKPGATSQVTPRKRSSVTRLA